MKTGAMVGTVVAVVVAVIVVALIIAFFIFKKYFQGRRGKGCGRSKGKDYSSAQSQIRKKSGTIEAVHVKRLTKKFNTNPAADPPESVDKVNQPVANGDVYIVPLPPPPEHIRT